MAVTWTAISPDLTGGPGRDQQYPFGTITTVAASAADPQRLLVGTDDGRLWWSHDLGSHWTPVTDPKLPGTWVTRVAWDPTDPKVGYATFSGFRSGDQSSYVLKTSDGGTTWADVSSYSRRQGKSTPIGGLMGEITFAGNLQPLLPLLASGVVLQVGKDTTKGNGVYTMNERVCIRPV